MRTVGICNFSQKSGSVLEKMAKDLIFRKVAYKKNSRFSGENRASSLFHTYNRPTCCKKSEKINDGKYENFGVTDGQTDRLMVNT